MKSEVVNSKDFKGIQKSGLIYSCYWPYRTWKTRLGERENTSIQGNMSSSNQPNKSSSEDPASKSEQQQYDDIHSSTGGQGGRKLTPLPLTNPNAKPGQNQVKFEYIIFLKFIKAH